MDKNTTADDSGFVKRPRDVGIMLGPIRKEFDTIYKKLDHLINYQVRLANKLDRIENQTNEAYGQIFDSLIVIRRLLNTILGPPMCADCPLVSFEEEMKE